jgi:hypothetical protein
MFKRILYAFLSAFVVFTAMLTLGVLGNIQPSDKSSTLVNQFNHCVFERDQFPQNEAFSRAKESIFQSPRLTPNRKLQINLFGSKREKDFSFVKHYPICFNGSPLSLPIFSAKTYLVNRILMI